MSSSSHGRILRLRASSLILLTGVLLDNASLLGGVALPLTVLAAFVVAAS